MKRQEVGENCIKRIFITCCPCASLIKHYAMKAYGDWIYTVYPRFLDLGTSYSSKIITRTMKSRRIHGQACSMYGREKDTKL
jgi:hypothetical protein